MSGHSDLDWENAVSVPAGWPALMEVAYSHGIRDGPGNKRAQ